jgi:spore germination cell wall hydrolase CwlJ-like protein
MKVDPEAIDVMARTIFGESRGEPFVGQVAVGHVIYNRALAPSWWGDDIKSVCLKPKQFSCWNEDDPNRDMCMTATLRDPRFQKAYAAACMVVSREWVDVTHGATHYHADYVHPSWAEDLSMTTKIGSHLFYK